MFTLFYRGYYINGYIDKPQCFVLGIAVKPTAASSLAHAKVLCKRHAGKFFKQPPSKIKA